MSDKKSGDKPDLDEELDRLQARLPHKVAHFMKRCAVRRSRRIAFRPASR